VLLLKRSGGPVVGVCRVGQVWSYRLDPATWSTIRRDFSEAMCAQSPDFWIDRERASYATLMRLHEPLSIEPFAFPKRDRRGWVVLSRGSAQSRLALAGESKGVFG
jgi:hypothetical protein